MRSSWTTRSRTSVPSSPRRSRPRPTTSPVTVRRPRPCWPRPWCTEGLRAVAAGAELRVGLKRGIDVPQRLPSATPPEGRGPRESTTRQDIASRGDGLLARQPRVGDLLAEAFGKVGKDGVITVEESNTTLDRARVLTEGMQFDKGYQSRRTSSPTRSARRRSSTTPYILINQGKISAIAGASCRCWRRSSRPASRSSSLPRTSRARRSPPWSSTSIRGTLQRRRRQGPRLRRPPQGDPAGHRDRSPAAQVISPEVGLKPRPGRPRGSSVPGPPHRR